jgi:small-conductance mechanosensitive channel
MSILKVLLELGVIVIAIALLALQYQSSPSQNAFFGDIQQQGAAIAAALLTLIVASLFLRVTTRFVKGAMRGRFSEVWGRIYRIVVWAVAIVLAVSRVYGDIGQLAVSLGLIGAAIALALQQPILSFFGWLSIISNKPFKEGDRILIGSVKGDVAKIGVIYTTLKEFSMDGGGEEPTGRVVIVPNSQALTTTITNYTIDFPYVWDEVAVSITHESNLKLAKELLFEATKKIVGKTMEEGAISIEREYRRYTDIKKEPAVTMQIKGPAIELRVRYICEARKRRSTSSAITEEILRLIRTEKYKGKVTIV